MNSEGSTKKIWTFVIACILLLAITAIAENHESSPSPRMLAGDVINNGPVAEGAPIIFTGQCNGENTKLVLCRENTICNPQTQAPDLLCASEVSSTPEKTCTYATTATDGGLHENDIATCCTAGEQCDTTVALIEPWQVNTLAAAASLTVVDDNSNTVQVIINQQGITTNLQFSNQPITKMLFTNLQGTKIGVSKITRGIIPPEGVEFGSVFGLDLEEVSFTEATFTTTAIGSSLYQCRFWDFALSTCVGSWEFVKTIEQGKEYSFNLAPGSFGFAEATSAPQQQPEVPPEIPPEPPVQQLPIEEPVVEEPILIEEPVPELTVEGPITNDGPVEEGAAITFIGSCNRDNARLMLCKENSICNAQTPAPDIICESGAADEKIKTCQYTAAAADTGNHDADIATCCTDDGQCASTTILVEPWTVTSGKTITPADLTINPLISSKKDFKLDENAVFDFEYLAEEELSKHNKSLERSKQQKQRKTWIGKEVLEVFVYDIDGKPIALNLDIEELREGKFQITLNKKRQFKAGKYQIKVSVFRDGILREEEHTFTWGVLAINTDKSIYLSNENAFIGMAVLDDLGKIVCDANVMLDITDPKGSTTTLSTANGEITISEECSFLGVTKLPDYYTTYTVGDAGNYTMKVTAVTKNGVRTVEDIFLVQQTIPFDVTRNGPTRVFPPVPYTMNFTIKANQDYEGVISEYVPASFVITSQQGLEVTLATDTKVLSWNQKWQAGQIYEIAYEFDAPDISPEFYLLGALDIGVWKEQRQWQIANDAPAKLRDDTLGVDKSSIEVGEQMNITLTGTCINNACSGFDAWIETAAGAGTEIPASTCSAGSILKTVAVGFTGCATCSAGASGHRVDTGSLARDAAFGRINWTVEGCEVGGPTNFRMEADASSQVNTVSVTVTAAQDNTLPTYSDIVFSPINETNYSLTQFYEFNATWDDNVQIESVFIAFDDVNYSLGDIYNDSNVYSFNRTGLFAGDHNFTWVANDTSGNENQTAFELYTVAKAESGVNLTFDDAPANLTVNVYVDVNITADREAGEDNIQLFQDGVLMNEGNTYLSNLTNFTSINVFNITAFHPETANFTSNFTTLFITTIDNLAPVVNLTDPKDNNITSTETIANITFLSNATDNLELSNATLYHNITGIWEANETININGTFNETSFSIDIAPTTAFIWNVLYCDSLDNCDFAENNFTVTVQTPQNTAPIIEAIDGPGGNTIAAQSVTEDNNPTPTNLEVTFTVTDQEGVADLNATEINITLYNTTYISTDVNYFSQNNSCHNVNNISSTQANFTCTLELNYWYTAGEWNITVGVTDISGASSQNATNISIQETTAIVIDIASLGFDPLTIGQENYTATTDPITINNTANDYIDTNNVRVTGLDLVGEQIDTQAIETGNFTVDIDNGGSPPAECTAATQLVNATATGITGAVLSAGNRSVSNEAMEQLYVCLSIVPNGLSAQAYSTLNSTTGWTISVV